MLSEVTIVIPTYSNDNGLFDLITVLSKANLNIIVVDNKPNHNKIEYFNKNKQDRLKYLPQKKNLGFAAGVNYGAIHACTKWLVILNDDIILKSSKTCKLLLEKLVAFAQKNSLVATSPVLLNTTGYPENYGFRVLPQGKVELNLDSKNRNIDGLTAACLLIDKQVFEKVGGFDKRFFAYLEDVDLFLRLKKLKYKFAVYVSRSVTHNHLTTSSLMKKGFKEWHDMKNWWLITMKTPSHFSFQAGFFLERLRNLKGYIQRKLYV